MGSKVLGDELARAIKAAHYDQSSLSRKTGIDRTWINQLVNGKIDRPGTTRLRTLADVLGMDYERMLAQTDQLSAVLEERGRSEAGSVTAPDLAAAFRHFAEIQQKQTDAIESLARVQQAQTDALSALVGEIRAMRLSGAPGALVPEDLEKIVGLVAGTLEAETVDVRESAGSGRGRRMVARRGGSGAPA